VLPLLHSAGGKCGTQLLDFTVSYGMGTRATRLNDEHSDVAQCREEYEQSTTPTEEQFIIIWCGMRANAMPNEWATHGGNWNIDLDAAYASDHAYREAWCGM